MQDYQIQEVVRLRFGDVVFLFRAGFLGLACEERSPSPDTTYVPDRPLTPLKTSGLSVTPHSPGKRLPAGTAEGTPG